jgi:hypothetical protein
MALSNAEKQRRWRARRNELATALTGEPEDVVNNLLRELGEDGARKVARALGKRLRNLKSSPGGKPPTTAPELTAPTPAPPPATDLMAVMRRAKRQREERANAVRLRRMGR